MDQIGTDRNFDSEPSEPTLLRALNLPLLTLYGLGVTIGAGIYVLVGATAEVAGTHAPLAFLIAAVVAAFTALSYTELADRFPVSAGEAIYVEAGFETRRLTLPVGLLVALSGIVSASAIAIGAGAYLQGITGLPVSVLAISVVVAMGLLAAWGIAQSVTVAAIVTLVEIAGLLLVISWGLAGTRSTGAAAADLVPDFSSDTWAGIGAASLLAFFAFVGFEDMVNVAEEVQEPARTYPRAIILTLVIATLLYAATTTAVILSVPMVELAGSAAPLALVFADAPTLLRDLFVVIAIVATMNGILIQIIMASRVFFGLARGGHLPRQLSAISPLTRTPIVATALVVLIIAVLTQALPIETLAERTSQIVLIVFILVNLALLRLKSRTTAPAAEFSIPRIVPAIGAVSGVALMLSGLL
ncbi:APC family permease [Sphingopyxis sp. P8]|uniref:APC family permease n=1 Tax=Sphingopyxis sp. P8 TaxID=2763256 RepID=UPI001D0BA08F|nr:APC family permease [Sphingopyxis sp. P8]